MGNDGRIFNTGSRCVALLRGVNVGGRQRVPMADLRALLAGLGAVEVRTLLNSGNAVFGAAAGAPARSAAKIEGAIRQQLGLDVPVIVKSAQQFAAIVDGNALASAVVDPSRLLVVFAPDAPAIESLSVLTLLLAPDERFHLTGHAAYLLCSAGILQSKAAQALLGKVGRLCTTRNWGTVHKLAGLLGDRQA